LAQHPLVVDLDGTLILTDMLHESALRLLRLSPARVLHMPFWLAKGRAVLKARLAASGDFDPSTTPYNHDLLDWLRAERAGGRRLVLCTAADSAIAESIAGHLEIFDEVIASNGVRNLAGEAKAVTLESRFGASGFDYAGNSATDMAVWRRARRAIVVNASRGLAERAGEICDVERVFPQKSRGFAVWGQMLRVHQWLKNLLLVMPALAGHDFHDPAMWLPLALAFLSFSLCASAVYIANDLLDLESDRLHPRKKNRPFAAGLVPTSTGLVAGPLLMCASLAIGSLVGGAFLGCLAFYFLLTCLYSWTLKKLVLVDCLTLAMLYTIRIITGAVVVGHHLSFWLLAFSVFLFLSLAFVKRYAELAVLRLSGTDRIHGRGYQAGDAPLIQTMGVASGYAAVLVLALYLNSDAVVTLYRAPQVIWGAVPVMLFWISWMWMQAHRGRMHDDPLVFAVKDGASLVTGLAFAGVLVAGTVGLPW